MRYSIKLGLILAGLLLLPFVLVFTMPCVVSFGFTDMTARKIRRTPCIFQIFALLLVWSIVFSLAMAVNVIAVPIAIIIAIPLGIWYMIYMRRKVHKRSERRLQDIIDGKA